MGGVTAMLGLPFAREDEDRPQSWNGMMMTTKAGIRALILC